MCCTTYHIHKHDIMHPTWMQAAVQWAHVEPWSPEAWLMAALVAVHRAGVLGTAAAYRAAAELCRRAILLHRAIAGHHSPAGGSLANSQPGSSLAAGSDAEQLPGLQVQHPLVQLQCGLSECLLHSHLEGCTVQALEAAKAAIKLAPGEHQPAAWAYHQIGRWAKIMRGQDCAPDSMHHRADCSASGTCQEMQLISR